MTGPDIPDDPARVAPPDDDQFALLWDYVYDEDYPEELPPTAGEGEV